MERLQYFLSSIKDENSKESFLELLECIKSEIRNDFYSLLDADKACIYRNLITQCLEYVTKNQLIFRNLEYCESHEILYLLLLLRFKIVENQKKLPGQRGMKIADVGCFLVKKCIKSLDYEKASYYFNLTLSLVEQLLANSFEKNEIKLQSKLDCLKITLLSYQIEILAKSNEYVETLNEINSVKSKLSNFPMHQKYIAYLCFNMGLKYLNSDYKVTLSFFEHACDIGSTCFSTDFLCSIHKLISETYLKHNPENNWKKAMDILELPYPNIVGPDYITLKVRASFNSKNENLIWGVLKDLLKWKNLSVILSFSVIQLLLDHQHLVLAARFLRQLRTRFSSDEMLEFFSIELKIIFQINNIQEAKSAIEHVLNVMTKGQISLEKVNIICKVLINYATSRCSQKDPNEMIVWYQYCDKFCEYQKDREHSLYFLIQKQLCFYSIKADNLLLAEKAFSKLKSQNDDSFYNYLALQLAIIKNDDNLDDKILHFIEEGESLPNLLSCCFTAFSNGKKAMLLKILEAILSRDEIVYKKQMCIRVSQCLIRLYLDQNSDQDEEKIKICLNTALEALQNNQVEESEQSEMSQWFSRVAWNLALKEGQKAELIFDFILKCCSFMVLCGTSIQRLKNGLLLAAAAGLNVALLSSSDCQDIINKVMKVLQQCRCLEKENNSTTYRLICLYELEARFLTMDPSLEATLDNALNSGCLDMKSLELITSFSNNMGSQNYTITIKVLKAIIAVITKEDKLNYSLLSKAYHSLLQLLFFIQEHLNSELEEEIFTTSKSLMLLMNDDYPQLEILWLMAKSWNHGVKKLSVREKDPLAKEWCSLALVLLSKLHTLRSLHDQKMKRYYTCFFETSNM